MASNIDYSKATFLNYITSRLKLSTYRNSIVYKDGDIVLHEGGVYRSLCDDNYDNNPRTSVKWIKLI